MNRAEVPRRNLNPPWLCKVASINTLEPMSVVMSIEKGW